MGVKRRINTINNQIAANETTIEMLKNKLRNDNLTQKKKVKIRSKIHDLEQKNKKTQKRKIEEKC